MKQILLRSLIVGPGLLLAGLIFTSSPSGAHAQPPPEKAAKADGSQNLAPKAPAASGESETLTEARFRLQAALLGNADSGEVIALRSRISFLEGQEPRKMNIDFPGGHFSTLLDMIATNPGVSFSVVNTGEGTDSAATLPDFSLRNVTVQTVMEVAKNLLAARGFNLVPVSVERNSVICMLERQPPAKLQPSAPKSDFASYQLAPYLTQQSVDDIISAIRTAWELDPTHDKNDLHLKYHPATTMLLVAGSTDGVHFPSEANNVTRKILAELKRSPKVEPVPLEKK